MAFSQNTTPTIPKQPRSWQASIGNGDASAWKFLYRTDGTLVGANGSKITAALATSNDTTARVLQLAKARVFTGATITIATPGVVSWALANGNNAAVGDQVVFLNNGDTLPTGLSFNTTYFIISGGFSFGVSFELATSAGGSAIATSGSQSGTHQIALIRPAGAVTAAITAGTDGATAAADLMRALNAAWPQDNDGQQYDFLEASSATNFDALAVSCTGTVTANKMISVVGIGADF